MFEQFFFLLPSMQHTASTPSPRHLRFWYRAHFPPKIMSHIMKARKLTFLIQLPGPYAPLCVLYYILAFFYNSFATKNDYANCSRWSFCRWWSCFRIIRKWLQGVYPTCHIRSLSTWLSVGREFYPFFYFPCGISFLFLSRSLMP